MGEAVYGLRLRIKDAGDGARIQNKPQDSSMAQELLAFVHSDTHSRARLPNTVGECFTRRRRVPRSMGGGTVGNAHPTAVERINGNRRTLPNVDRSKKAPAKLSMSALTLLKKHE